MPRPDKHVFICTQNRPQGHPRGSCTSKGCAEIMTEFMNEIQSRNLFEKIGLTNTGCMGPCMVAPVSWFILKALCTVTYKNRMLRPSLTNIY